MVIPDPNVNASVGEADARDYAEPVRSADDLAHQMLLAASQGDAALAASLLQLAEERYSGDPRLDVPSLRCHYIVDRGQALSGALQQMRLNLEEDRFTSATGQFREALCLSKGFPKLEEQTTHHVVLNAELLLPRNWRVAETLLRETAATFQDFFVPPGLSERLQHARVDELVTIAIYQADKAEFTGTTDEARKRLTGLISAYPAEQRLADRLRELNTPRQVTKRTPTPFTRSAVQSPVAPEALDDSVDWHAIKNMAASGGATVMLALAGFLVWHHFSTSPTASKRSPTPPSAPIIAASTPKAPVVQPPAVPPGSVLPAATSLTGATAADEQAWELVKSSDSILSLKAFIAAYPLSPHVLRARVRMSAIEWSKVSKEDTEALETYLRAHPRSFYASEARRLILQLNAQKLAAAEAPSDSGSDRDAILNAVRAYREAQANAAASDEVILEEPVINGNQATVRVHLSGNTASTSSFSVMKTDGKWQVTNSQ